MLKRLKQISSSVQFENDFWIYRTDLYQKPNGGTGDYHYVDSRGSTMIVPRLEQNKFVMVRQYRYLNQRESIEFPGGGIKEGLTPIENARQELVEETGYEAEKIHQIGFNNPFNGVTNEICSVFLAQSLIKSVPDPDSSEEFEILIFDIDEILSNIKKGIIWDGMTLAAWSTYFFGNR